MAPAAPVFEIPERELVFSFARSSGPGGQNVNKTETKATLRWDVSRSPSIPADVRARFVRTFATRITTDGELVISSQRHRDRLRNIDDCLEKLQSMLRQVAKPRLKRRPTRPSRGAVERRIVEKKRRGGAKRERRRPAED
ncbi:MAG: aminoacyl-tRNA hydrolase [Deltaproteobacteria bacterium]|nr:aminoacyl-tRNA hydrolase [Deltaproteobacteria bacterium]